jgi:hypothetical protein
VQAGNSSHLHLHIHAAMAREAFSLRPLPFRNIAVIDWAAFQPPAAPAMVDVNGQGLPNVWSAILPQGNDEPVMVRQSIFGEFIAATLALIERIRNQLRVIIRWLGG